MDNFVNYTYIVECADYSLYTGWSNHIRKRIENHNEGKGAKYTKTRRPVKLVFVKSFETKQEAMQQEAKIKRLSREKKLGLIASNENELKDFIEI